MRLTAAHRSTPDARRDAGHLPPFGHVQVPAPAMLESLDLAIGIADVPVRDLPAHRPANRLRNIVATTDHLTITSSRLPRWGRHAQPRAPQQIVRLPHVPS